MMDQQYMKSKSYSGGEGSIAIGTKALSNIQMSKEFKKKEINYDGSLKYQELDTDDLPDKYFTGETKLQGSGGKSTSEVGGVKKTRGYSNRILCVTFGENSL